MCACVCVCMCVCAVVLLESCKSVVFFLNDEKYLSHVAIKCWLVINRAHHRVSVQVQLHPKLQTVGTSPIYKRNYLTN